MQSLNSENKNLPNFIIAGVNKAGTTSLFSYLVQHPEVAGSQIKETCYFLPLRYNKQPAPIEEYKDQFINTQNKKIIMESTPGYFYGGQKLVSRIKLELPDVKVVLMLRNPSDRLCSFFSFMKSMLFIDKELSLSDYISKCSSLQEKELKEEKNNPYFGVEGGYYYKYLPEWVDAFGDNLKIVFFDDFKNKTKDSLVELMDWLGLDKDKISSIDLGVQNKTASYKAKWLHKLALNINKKFEVVFRKKPKIKKILRDIYSIFNSSKIKNNLTEDDKKILNRLYQAPNQKLKQYLETLGFSSFPSWLNSYNEE